MRYPNIDFVVPDDPSTVHMSAVYDYLNEVLRVYGPPCEWCRHYKYTCSLRFKPREYDMALGPFENWHLRKQCGGFSEVPENTEEADAVIRRKTGAVLDCFVQQYC
jgi:hypothetical protein